MISTSVATYFSKDITFFPSKNDIIGYPNKRINYMPQRCLIGIVLFSRGIFKSPKNIFLLIM